MQSMAHVARKGAAQGYYGTRTGVLDYMKKLGDACIFALVLIAIATPVVAQSGVFGVGSNDNHYVSCPPSSCVNGHTYVCSNTATVYVGRGGNCEVTSDPNGNFLPISGGTMTGTMTADDKNEAAITVPTYADANSIASMIRFNTRGNEPYPWSIGVTGATPFNTASDHDHVFAHLYNLTWDPTNGLVPVNAASNKIRMGFESRYVSDPNAILTDRGKFEFNIDIDPNTNATWTSSPWRPFFFGAYMGTNSDPNSRTSEFTIGDPTNSGSSPATSDMLVNWNIGGKCSFCFWASDYTNRNSGKVEFGSFKGMGANSSSILTQGRIILDTIGQATTGSDPNLSDRAAMFRNLWSSGAPSIDGTLEILSGLDPNGRAQDIYISKDDRASNIRIGNAFDTSRVSLNNTDPNQTALSIRGPSNQAVSLATFAARSRTIMLVNPFSGIGVGDGSGFGGLIDADGYQDQVQLHVVGHSTQTNNIILAEDANGVDLLALSNSGVITGTATANWNTSTKCINIDPASTVTNWLFWRTTKAITVTSIDCIVDASTSVVMTLQECNANGASCADTEAAITCGTTNTQVAGGSIDDTAIDATDWIRVTRGTVSGSPTQVSLCMTYTTP